MKPISDLIDLLIVELKNLYAIENTELTEMTNFIFKIENDPLKEILQAHNDQTKRQIIRLGKSLSLFGEIPSSLESKFIQTYFKETKRIILNTTELSVIKAKIILFYQTLSHIEIASYGTLLAYSQKIKMVELSNLLKTSLEEVKTFDLKLSMLAELKINEDALFETFIPIN